MIHLKLLHTDPMAHSVMREFPRVLYRDAQTAHYLGTAAFVILLSWVILHSVLFDS